MQIIKLSLIFFYLSLTISSCGDDRTLPENSYEFFTILKTPEKEIFYPEDRIIFEFNMPISEKSTDKIVLETEFETETSPIITVRENTLSIDNLPADNTLYIEFKPGLKSMDNKPLVVIDGSVTSSKNIMFQFSTGSKFPHLEPTGKREKAHTMLLSFTDEIDVTKDRISPTPTDLLYFNTELLLYYEKDPPESVLLQNLTTPKREGVIPDIKIDFSSGSIMENIETPIFYEIVSDNSYSFTAEHPEIVGIVENNKFSPCENSCSILKKNLEPLTDYNFSFMLYLKNDKYSIDNKVTTSEAVPHIMISEVMHSPSSDPEKSGEFIELYNYSKKAFNLAECHVDDKNDGKGIDPLIPPEGGGTLLKPGEIALIISQDSQLSPGTSSAIKYFYVDDTTIADAGLSSTESIQVICPDNDHESIVAEYKGNVKFEKGYSVTIDLNGDICSSAKEGGSPGLFSSCE